MMKPQTILGILLLIGGAALFFFGYQASQSVGEQVFETFAGRFTESTTWYLIGGAAAALCGVILLAMQRNIRA
ncbi:DUF3185 family protein [Alcanivorax sp. JB21]|uniref:DUF3185 family protein n=1 Tax=Alcanivorax limicola TaxID=2874102 RepID=UPI001CBBE4CF|nr:DUF3185 family protein [Alcanivorax limicola]MBZ2190559.1 DUF3185 family protein [Alcanivorax limicola]